MVVQPDRRTIARRIWKTRGLSDIYLFPSAIEFLGFFMVIRNHATMHFRATHSKINYWGIRLTQVHTISCVSIQRLAPQVFHGQKPGRWIALAGLIVKWCQNLERSHIRNLHNRPFLYSYQLVICLQHWHLKPLGNGVAWDILACFLWWKTTIDFK